MSESRFDRELLGALYAQHQGELFRYATRYTGDADLAEDIVQEAFMRLAERPPVDLVAIRAWLYRSVTTIAIDTHRTHRRRGVIAEHRADFLPAPQAGPDPAAAAEQAEIRVKVHAALEQLDERDRTVLLMREEGFAHREIAEAVGTTTKSVGTMIARALVKLAQHLDLDGTDV